MMRKIAKEILLFAAALAAFTLGGREGKLYAMPTAQRTILSNNLVVLVSEAHTLPFVTFELLVDAGSWRDPSDAPGLAYLASKAILLGTVDRSLSAINEKLDYMGASLETSCRRDYASLSFRSLKKNLYEGFALFVEVLTKPAFPKAEVERRIEEIKGVIQAEKDEPSEVAEKAFHEALFLDSPYAHPIKGTAASLSRMSREAVANFYEAFYRPGIAILAVVGDVTPEEVKEKLVPLLEKWQDRPVPEEPFQDKFANGPATVKIDKKISQANIVLGNAGIARSNEDYYAVSVMNHILGGGGFSSRLMEEIRVKRGLAYAVASRFVTHKHPGSFQIVLQTKNESAREAISLALEQMRRMQKEPVDEQALETAKKYLIGSFPLRLVTQRALAAFFSQVQYYGLGLDYPERYPSLIRAVTRDDVLRAAKKRLRPEERVLTVVADLEKANLRAADR